MISLAVIVAAIAAMALTLRVFVHARAALTYLKNIAIGVDQLANAICGGDPDETISSVAGKARRHGRQWGCWLCTILDWIDHRHCDGSIENDEGRRAVWKMRAKEDNPAE